MAALHIICQWYSETNPKRHNELLACVQRNLNHPAVAHVWNLAEPGQTIKAVPASIAKHTKYHHVTDWNTLVKPGAKPGRLTYAAAFAWANKSLPQGTVCCLVNLDIHLDERDAAAECWSKVKDQFFAITDKPLVLCLSRHEIDAKGNIWRDGYAFKACSADAWCFETPVHFDTHRTMFSVGNCPCCDVCIAKAFDDAGYHIYNWAGRYPVMHFDRCREGKTKGRMIFTDTTDYSAKTLVQKHGRRDTCPYLKYEEHLSKGTAPPSTPRCNRYNRPHRHR